MSKTVLITGSTSGIGKAIAEGFAKKGYNIIFNGLETDGPVIAQNLATAYEIEYMYSAANMLQPDELRSMVESAISQFGAVDILINNAGIQHVSPLETFPDEKWDAILGVNLSAAFHLTKAVWPSMKQQKYGRIINMSSAHGLVASENKSAYVASKHGLIGFTKATALEGAPFNITCNAVCPGYVHTPIVEGQIADQMRLHNMSADEVVQNIMLAKHAIKSFVPIELVVNTVLFLAEESASAITGIALPVEAGWTAQ
ncbi:MAG: 3-hydroxybutyrate dehydrogenase [Chitinophagaceae bacterium]|nr:3-hydroxybutyrate dehydrogenase [Chitinophagaceae bacterium]